MTWTSGGIYYKKLMIIFIDRFSDHERFYAIFQWIFIKISVKYSNNCPTMIKYTIMEIACSFVTRVLKYRLWTVSHHYKYKISNDITMIWHQIERGNSGVLQKISRNSNDINEHFNYICRDG